MTLPSTPTPPMALPPLSGRQAVHFLRDRLAEAGLPRTSHFAGAEINGWIATNRLGSTGFSVRLTENDQKIDWHLVVSGQPHFRYANRSDRSYYPVDPERLVPTLRTVFRRIGLEPESIRCTGWATGYDDDVEFNVLTERPSWLLSSNEPVSAPQAETSLVDHALNQATGESFASDQREDAPSPPFTSIKAAVKTLD